MGRLRPCALLSLLVVALLLVPAGGAATSTIGVNVGTSLEYYYTIVSTYKTPNGNATNITYANETVTFEQFNLTLGEALYTLVIDNANGTTESTTSGVTNSTYIFDPAVNVTYLGTLGFFPLTYTDLSPGNWTGLPVTVGLYNVTGLSGTFYATQKVNASLSMSNGRIDIGYVVYGASGSLPTTTEMVYNGTTGVLQKSVTVANAFDVEKTFTYILVGVTLPPSEYLRNLAVYIVAGVVVVLFAAAAAHSVLTRGSRRDRKSKRLREKLGPA